MTETSYEEIFERIKKQVKDIKEELKGLEESGKADNYPVKHQKAVDLASEIDEQIKSLEEGLKKGLEKGKKGGS